MLHLLADLSIRCPRFLLGRSRRLVIATTAAVVAAVLAVPPPVAAQQPSRAEWVAALNIDTMRTSVGAPWSRHQSPHFLLYTEYAGTRATHMLDSLEAAWAHATELIGYTPTDTARITVFVTASRTRFPLLLTPKNKGVRAWLPDGRDVIVLVVNDSVRS
jgi:hypothetical protein